MNGCDLPGRKDIVSGGGAWDSAYKECGRNPGW